MKVKSEKNKALRNIVLMIIMLVLIVLTFKFLFRNQDLSEIKNIIKSVNKLYLIAAISAIALYVFLGGYAIKVPINSMGYKMPYRHCFKYSLTEIYFSGITPSNTGGQPMVAVAMKADKYKFADIAMVLMAVTALYKIGLLFLGGGFLLCSFSYVFSVIGYVRFLLYLGVFINIVFVGMLFLLMFSNNLFWVIEKVLLVILLKLRIIKKADVFMNKVIEQKTKYGQCADFFKGNPIVVLKMFIILLIQRVCLLIITYFVYKSFGLSGTSLFQILAIQIVMSLSVEMMPLPGAVGVSESVFILLYDAVFGKLLVYPALLLARGINFYLPFLVSTVYIFCRFLKDLFFNKGDNDVRIL